MTVDPGVSIVISFLGFVWLFMKKIYPSMVKMLDGHIEAVKNKIREAETLKEEAVSALEEARTKKNDIDEIIEKKRLESEENIKRLYEENAKHLEALREKFEASLKSRLEAELAKQKARLMAQLSDEIIQKLSEHIKSGEYDIDCEVTKENLRKLL
jgi:F0F1-type ATP synthase membrane subunit b/b'